MAEVAEPSAGVRKRIDPLEILGIIIIGVMVLHMVIGVISRAIFDHPVPATIEMVSFYYMVGISFIGMYLSEKRRDHVMVEILSQKLSATAAKILSAVTGLLLVVGLLVLTWYGLEEAIVEMERGEIQGVGSSQIPVWPGRFIVPVSFALFAIAAAWNTIRDVRKGPDADDAEDEAEKAAAGVAL